MRPKKCECAYLVLLTFLEPNKTTRCGAGVSLGLQRSIGTISTISGSRRSMFCTCLCGIKTFFYRSPPHEIPKSQTRTKMPAGDDPNGVSAAQHRFRLNGPIVANPPPSSANASVENNIGVITTGNTANITNIETRVPDTSGSGPFLVGSQRTAAPGVSSDPCSMLNCRIAIQDTRKSTEACRISGIGRTDDSAQIPGFTRKV